MWKTWYLSLGDEGSSFVKAWGGPIARRAADRPIQKKPEVTEVSSGESWGVYIYIYTMRCVICSCLFNVMAHACFIRLCAQASSLIPDYNIYNLVLGFLAPVTRIHIMGLYWWYRLTVYHAQCIPRINDLPLEGFLFGRVGQGLNTLEGPPDWISSG